MSLKTDRINTQILREVSLILQNEVRDRDLRMCTITAVETTNDLSISKVYVTFLGKNYNQEGAVVGSNPTYEYYEYLIQILVFIYQIIGALNNRVL